MTATTVPPDDHDPAQPRPPAACGRSARPPTRRRSSRTAISAAASQAMSADRDEEDGRDRVGHGGQHVLDRVEALQVVGERDPQDREQDHALGGAEVAAVDAGQERAAGRRDEVVALRLARRRLERHQRHGHQDQDRDDRVEHLVRQLEQEDAADERADRRADRERQDAPLLPAQLAPVAQRAADPAEHEPDGVGDVGRHRRIADRQQRRERHQRARADDRVDRPRDHAGPRHGEHLEERHPPDGIYSARSAGAGLDAASPRARRAR